jgi:DNA-binding transcriptional ArsR family regulator
MLSKYSNKPRSPATLKKRPAMSIREIRHPATADLDLATILRAAGDPVRLAVVRLLADDRERTCTELRVTLDMPASTLSYHLRLLREAGITRSRPAGTERHVSLRRDDLERRYPGLVDVLVSGATKAARAA